MQKTEILLMNCNNYRDFTGTFAKQYFYSVGVISQRLTSGVEKVEV